MFNTCFSINKTKNMEVAVILFSFFGFVGAISNGYRAVEHEFPFVVSVQDQWGIHYFDGIIISPSFVLTSCDNLATVNPGKFEIKTEVYNSRLVAGSTYLLAAVVTRFPDKLFPHPKCREVGGIIEYDVGLIQITEPYEFSKAVRPAKLAYDEAWLEGMIKNHQALRVVGWGDTKEVADNSQPGEPNPHLYVLGLKLADHQSCTDYLCEGISECKTSITTICTSPLDFGSLCVGDAGSPMYYENHVWAVSTFVSKPCSQPQYHIYTRLDMCKPWIYEMILTKEVKNPELYASAPRNQSKNELIFLNFAAFTLFFVTISKTYG